MAPVPMAATIKPKVKRTVRGREALPGLLITVDLAENCPDDAVIRGAARPVEGGYRLRGIAEELGDPRDMAPWHGFDEDFWLIDADEKGGPRYSGDMEREIELRAGALLRAIPNQYF